MKNLITLLISIFFITNIISQIPNRMSYQAVIRNNSNELVTNKQVGIKISIVSGSAIGPVVYSERFPAANTNSNGLVTLEIGGGNNISGNFSNINWGSGDYFIRMEIDPSGGFNYTISGESQLLTVPYAFYAAKSANQFSGDYNDLTNKPLLFSGNYNDLTNKPDLFSGNYYDLTNRQKVVEYTGTVATGDILYRKGQNWELLKSGTNGQTLRLNNGLPSWGEPGYALPILTTLQATEIKHTSAISGGYIINKGYTEVTQTGICWSTGQNPTTIDSKTTLGAFTSGSFESTMTGLLPNTKYNVRAYATNGAGTAYGNQVSFTTAPAAVVFPTVTTNPVINISENTAVSGGNVSSSGGADVVARGVCWSINQNPTIINSKTTDGDGTGFYYSQLTGLQGGTKYYARAYATNSAGTGYGPIESFTTSKILPIVTTKAITDISPISAATGGIISHNGGGTISDKGICWSETPDPTLDNNKISAGTGPNTYSTSLSILRPNTTYYVRAYAVNEIGTSYGNEISFTTQDGHYDGFETGFSGTYTGWSIVSTDFAEGARCLKTEKQGASVSLTKTSTSGGQIFFYTKIVVPSQDKIEFFIDNNKVAEYTNNYWGLETHPVSAGTHTYKWVATRQFSGELWSTVYLDCIVVPK